MMIAMTMIMISSIPIVKVLGVAVDVVVLCVVVGRLGEHSSAIRHDVPYSTETI